MSAVVVCASSAAGCVSSAFSASATGVSSSVFSCPFCPISPTSLLCSVGFSPVSPSGLSTPLSCTGAVCVADVLASASGTSCVSSSFLGAATSCTIWELSTAPSSFVASSSVWLPCWSPSSAFFSTTFCGWLSSCISRDSSPRGSSRGSASTGGAELWGWSTSACSSKPKNSVVSTLRKKILAHRTDNSICIPAGLRVGVKKNLNCTTYFPSTEKFRWGA